MTDQSSSNNGESVPPPVTFNVVSKAGWVIVVIIASVAILLAFRVATFETEVKLLQTDAELSKIEMQSVSHQLEAERIISTRQIADLKTQLALEPFSFVFLKSPQPSATCQSAIIAWLQSTQTGIFIADQLPPPASNEEYRLWIEDVAGGSMSVGAIAIAPTGPTQVKFKAAKAIQNATRIVLTRERLGGAGQRSGPVVLTGTP